MEDVTSEILKAAKGIDDPLERDKKLMQKLLKLLMQLKKS